MLTPEEVIAKAEDDASLSLRQQNILHMIMPQITVDTWEGKEAYGASQPINYPEIDEANEEVTVEDFLGSLSLVATVLERPVLGIYRGYEIEIDPTKHEVDDLRNAFLSTIAPNKPIEDERPTSDRALKKVA